MDTQILTIALSTAPTMLLVLVGILINTPGWATPILAWGISIHALGRRIHASRRPIHAIGELRSHMDVRFEEMKDLWRSELHRVEEVIDARLKHIEGR